MIRNFTVVYFLSLLLPCVTLAVSEPQLFFDLSGKEIGKETQSLAQYRGKVVLVTNIAIGCGTTPQLKDLQTLYNQHRDDGFVVLAFPSADFAPQEKREIDSAALHKFCKTKYGVSFPVYWPGHVTGDQKQSVFRFLTEHSPEEMQGEVGYNFEKFLIGRDGTVRERFGPFTGAMSHRLSTAIEKLIAENAPSEGVES